MLPPDFSRPARIVFRVDGGPSTGLGHLVRCQALAEALNGETERHFLVRDPTPVLTAELTAIGLQVHPLPPGLAPGLSEAEWLAHWLVPTDVLVLDGYAFDAAYQQTATATGAALLCFDDLVTAPLWADIVLNQAGGVPAAAYAAVPLAQLALGPAYALLRPAFWQLSSAHAPASLRLFLNMGGADPGNWTLALLPRLRQQFPNYAVAVLTGAAYPHQATLTAVAATDPAVTLHHNLPAAEVAALLRTCQVFVCPPSGVAYECCAAGGAVLLHQTADNQRVLFKFLTGAGLAIPLAEGLALPEQELSTVAARQLLPQRALFDGKAPGRLRLLVANLLAAQQLVLRRAVSADAALYFEWANDPEVRRHAINVEHIDWATHVAWFERRLRDTNCYLYLLLRPDGEPLGQVRVEFATLGQPGIIDYSLAARHRGQGLGAVLLRRALQRLRRERPALAGSAVLGQVKAENLASARVFEQLRFQRLSPVRLHGKLYEQFELRFPSDC